MRALVTGGAGFIGSNITRLLTERGHEVVVLDDLSTGYEKNLRSLSRVSLLRGDIRNLNAVKEAIAGCDTVFHLAANISNVKSIKDPRFDTEVNILGTLNVLQAMQSCSVKTIVFSSSAGIFGEPCCPSIDEEHPCNPASPYGIGKWASEKYVRLLSQVYHFRSVCFRYFNAYGTNQRFDEYGNVIPIFVTRILRGEPIYIYGDGEQTRDFVHVSDLAKANVDAAKSSTIQGTFNLGSGQAVSINRLVEMLREIMAEKIEAIYTEPRKGDVRYSLADISRAKKILGFEPRIRLQQGLRDYIRWLREET